MESVRSNGTCNCQTNNYSIQNINYLDETAPLYAHDRNIAENKICNILFLTILLTIFFVGMSTGIYLLLDEGSESRALEEYNLISRQLWSAHVPSSEMPNLKLPAASVLLLQTNGTSCENESQCAQLVRELQLKDMLELKEPDILYNFVFTGDGSIFEGRGWQFQARSHSEVTLAFSGLVGEPLRAKQMKSIKLFLDVAIMENKLQPCCDIFVWGENTFLINLAYNIQQTWQECH